MSNHVDALSSSMQKTNEWLRDVAMQLGEDSKQHAYSALRATLHALRDRLTVEQSAHFAAQLPLVLRGTFFEGWRPSQTGQRIRSMEDFLEAVRGHLGDTSPIFHEGCEEAVRSSLRVIAQHIDTGTVQKLQDSLPRDLRELWPAYT